jgi:hypothetical protein
MLFKIEDLEGIRSGKISLAFRKWKKPLVKAGSKLKTAVGVLEITSVAECDSSKITAKEAKLAGFADSKALLVSLNKVQEGTVYKIQVKHLSENPQVDLRQQKALNEEEYAELQEKLRRLDIGSNQGKWVVKMLKAIQANPKMAAADLAVQVKKEKEWLKVNVRKLKSLGLTISHEPGYTLSPLGEYLLARIEKESTPKS